MTIPDALGWRPIETAPKDGTRLLGWVVWSGDDLSEPHALIDVIEWFEPPAEAEMACPAGWDGRYVGKPTHWMPLPQPPEPPK